MEIHPHEIPHIRNGKKETNELRSCGTKGLWSIVGQFETLQAIVIIKNYKHLRSTFQIY